MSATVTSTCHCKAFSHKVHVDTATLPQPHTTCSCSSCRHRTGQLAILPFLDTTASSSNADSILDRLHHYDTVANSGSTVRTYFCGTCGSKLCILITGASNGQRRLSWMLGCLDRLEVEGKPLVAIRGHSFIEDTVDGGVAAFWAHAGGKQLSLQIGEDKEVKQLPKPEEAPVDEYLYLHCHCSAFSVYVSRPKPTLPLPKNCYWYRPPKNGGGIPQRYMASW